MKSFRHISSFILLIVLMGSLVSCRKNSPGDMDKAVEVTFSGQTVQKDTKVSPTKAALENIDYATVEIGNKTYHLPVYNLNGNIYTTSIKLDPGNYTLTKFLLMSNHQTPADSSDDQIVFATPKMGSVYAGFVAHPAGFQFNVQTLTKTQVSVEVLQFNPADYQKFGFDFTVLPQNITREQKFAGRLIVPDYLDYAGSLYASQTGGLQQDMPAIFKIDVFRDDQFVVSYNNEGQAPDSALRIEYPDDIQAANRFRFDLYVYVKTGGEFKYRFVHAWNFTDDEQLLHDPQGVVRFVVGDPQNQSANYAFGPVANLPQNCTLTLDNHFAPGSQGGYFDAGISGVTSPYSLTNGNYPAWCGTDTVSINLGHAYPMEVISSLTPQRLPAYAPEAVRWNRLNWLFNHLNRYAFYDWDILQGAGWMILNDWDGLGHSRVSGANSIVLQMVSDAQTHGDFIPSYGQQAAVIFIPQQTRQQEQTPGVQLVFTLIDL